MLESFKSSNFEYKKLTEEEQKQRGILGRLVGPIADYKNPTRNGRKYTEKLWEKVFSDPIVKEKIDTRSMGMELGHPLDERLETDWSKVCAILAEVPKKSSDGKLYGAIDVIDTPNGRILKTLLDYGSNVGISSRGEGDIISDYNGEEIVDPDTYQFETFDIVALPAVKSARLTPVTESLRSGKTLKQALLEDLKNSTDDDKLVMNETLESLGIDLTEGIQYKGYDMTITQSGVQLRKSDGSFIKEFPTEQEAKEYVDDMNESLNEDHVASKIKDAQDTKEMTRRAINMLKNLGGDWEDLAKEFKDAYGEDAITESLNEARDFDWKQSNLYAVIKPDGSFAGRPCLSYEEAQEIANQEDDRHIYKLTFKESLQENSNESSIKDVNIQKESEEEEADNDGDDLVAELQETLLKNADLEKLVKSLQERLSVCYAKEKRYEGQMNTYKSSIQSLRENSKKATSLEERLNSLQEELNSHNSELEEKDKVISNLKKSLQDSRSTLKEQVETHKEKQTAAKEIVTELTDKIQTLQEELEKVKNSKTTSIKVLKETYQKKESDFNSKFTELQKDSSQKLRQLQEKLNKANEVATKYQDIAKKAVNKYIVEKTSALNISADDVRNRLGKSYSFNDIDRICESLSASKLAINKLPFKVAQVSEVKMSESVKPSISSYANDGDYIDDQLAGLVERLS